MAYTHATKTVTDSSTELVATGYTNALIQNLGPKHLRVKLGAAPTAGAGILIIPGASLAIPFSGETPAGAINGIVGAGTSKVEVVSV